MNEEKENQKNEKLMKKKLPEIQQVKQFIDKTGKPRATYFLTKKELNRVAA